ncbi:AAA family ATPase [Rhizobium tumorigenes]|uniref:AAA family ATPase n=1 Tax=Rhizobium tumorigenes TaxID=2041385 RepID=A0AAF1K7L8_9HYPH|nr:AAA family ATPase [Rhizobium tumorigenes]WFR97597.1 AAA family ATPase [Rhizobium tumorigenes]WFS03199.1 AAA family ATPase [Rhizobium tumorigenes]
MLKRISHVRDFGVFKNFSGGALPEFAPFNLVYGWNYSGKTTLSRVFRCLEVGSLHPDYADATFSFIHQDGRTRDHGFVDPTIVRVFNEDFRKEHLLWEEEDGFNPILLLGSENIEKRRALAGRNEDLAAALDTHRLSEREVARLGAEIAAAESEVATLMVKELPVGRLDRRHVKQITAAWNGVLPAALADEVFKAEREKVSAEQKDELTRFAADASSIDDLWRTGLAVLTEQIGSAATIPRLAEHSDVGSWVERGLPLHRYTTRCEFCEGVIPVDRIAALNAHFSSAFAELKTRIAKAIEALNRRKLPSIGGIYAKGQFYGDIHAEHAEAVKAFQDAREAFNGALEELISSLDRKEASPFDVIAAPAREPPLEDVVASGERFQRLVDVNNARTREFRSAKAAALEILKKHYVAEAMRRIDVYRLEREIQEATTAGDSAGALAARLRSEIVDLQAELSESTKGAEAINDVLRRFFGKEDVQVEVTGGDKFTLMRSNRPAKNLSEGERTAIAFCYFITKLLENGNDLQNTIVYIDDPISSLDSHHLLHINAFIKSTFLKYDEDATPKYSCLAKQVFISTHNYEFFHLTWDWMANRKPKALSAAYMVERIDAAEVLSSRLVECPKSILQFRSEYLFLYHQLAAYADAPTDDALVIFNLGNMARRFMEGYLAFKFFEFSGIDQKLPLVITDAVDCERARKFMHFYSHTLSRAGGMKLPDLAEARAAVRSILDGVNAHDPVHFAALRSAV